MSFVAASTLRTHGSLADQDAGSSFSADVDLLERGAPSRRQVAGRKDVFTAFREQ